MPSIADICPGAFAEPPPLSQAEQDDLRRRLEALYGVAGRPWIENLRARRRQHTREFIERMPILPTWAELIAKPGPDSYPMSIGEPTLDNCTACSGTGEIVEFPADDDERMVCCPACGGTGEIYA